jgi:hypothetical protein
MLLLLPLVLFVAPAAAACPTTWPAATLNERLAAAEAAYSALDTEGFQRAVEDTKLMLPCSSTLIDPALAARYHRIEALRLFVQGHEAEATESLAAAKVLEPEYRFPAEMFDASHAFRVQYDAQRSTEGKTVSVPPARKGAVAFDGVRSRRRPVERATVVQILDEHDVPASTTYLTSGAAMPAYSQGSPSQVPLLIGAGLSVAASAVLYGLAWTANDSALDPADSTLTNARLEQYQSDTLILSLCSGGALLAGVGLTIGGVLPEFQR